MKSTIPLVVVLSVSGFLNAATTIYEEDFTSVSLPSSTQATIGFFNGNGAFNEFSVASNASVSGGVLEVSTTSGFRGVGIVFAPESFVGVGTYDLTFDIPNFNDNGNSGNSAVVNIWAGSGYGQVDDADALVLNAQDGTLGGLGSATASLISSGSYASAANQIQLQFEYDGSSAVAIFFGVDTGGFPFPSAEFDNISIATVPEPSSLLYLGVLPGFLLLGRRRRSRSSK